MYTATDVVALTKALADTATVLSGLIQSGHVSILDWPKLLTAVTTLKEFGSVDYKKVLPELENLTAEDVTAIVAAFNGNLNIQQPTANAAIKAGFDLIVSLGVDIQNIVTKVMSIKGIVQPATAA